MATIDFDADKDKPTEDGFLVVDGFTMLWGSDNPVPTGFIPPELLPSKSFQYRHYLNNDFTIEIAELAAFGVASLLGSLGFGSSSSIGDTEDSIIVNNDFIVQLVDADVIFNEKAEILEVEGKRQIKVSNSIYRVIGVHEKKEDGTFVLNDINDISIKSGETGEFFTGERFLDTPEVTGLFESVDPGPNKFENKVGEFTSDTINVKELKEELYVTYVGIKERFLRQEVQLSFFVAASGPLAFGRFIPRFVEAFPGEVKVRNYEFVDTETLTEEEISEGLQPNQGWKLAESYGFEPSEYKSIATVPSSDDGEVTFTETEAINLRRDKSDRHYVFDLKPGEPRQGFLSVDGYVAQHGKNLVDQGKLEANFKFFLDPDGNFPPNILETTNAEVINIGLDDPVSGSILFQAFFESPNYGFELPETARLLVEEFDTTLVPDNINFALIGARTTTAAEDFISAYFHFNNCDSGYDVASSEKIQGNSLLGQVPVIKTS